MSARCGEMHLSRTALQNRKQQALIDKLTEKIAKLEEAIEGKQKVNLELSKKVIALEKDANGEMAKELEEEWRTNLKLLAELEHERSMSTIDPAKQPFART
ncbi:hypothetical protein BU16DRAFT_528455 [Lophium mytilinum]|uniref:Uncharacterized protein n=1 Tax=Lophium mytilinum TaxID=390894 RepID=A0A6A6QLX0_9PEZI|nr:hypothetical protein BU16DRAFT_528455 [Lophium mytilinum]